MIGFDGMLVFFDTSKSMQMPPGNGVLPYIGFCGVVLDFSAVGRSFDV